MQDPWKRGLGPEAPEMAPGHPQAPVREGGPGFVPELRGSTFSGLSCVWGREQRWPWPGLRGGVAPCVYSATTRTLRWGRGPGDSGITRGPSEGVFRVQRFRECPRSGLAIPPALGQLL